MLHWHSYWQSERFAGIERGETLFFLLFFGDGSSIVEWYRRSYRKCLCFLCCRHKSGLLPTSFLKSTLLFLTFLMRKHTVLIDGFLSLKIQFQQLLMRLRDVTPSHITSLDVKPSEVRTLEVSTSGRYTFGQLHLRTVSPSEYYIFGILHLRKLHLQIFHLWDIIPSRHYNFAKLKPSTVSENVPRWKVQRCNFPKVKLPKVQLPEVETSRRWNIPKVYIQKVKYPKV